MNEGLNLKQCHADVWSIREQLCLASAVVRSGDQNWAAVSRTLRLLSTEKNLPPDWYSTKNCAIQYSKLLEKVDTPKRKREKHESNTLDTPEETVRRTLTRQRIEELVGNLEEEKASYNQLYKEMNLLESGQLDHCFNRLWEEMTQDQEREEEEKLKHQKWLMEREKKVQAIQHALKLQSKGSPFKRLQPTKPETLQFTAIDPSKEEETSSDSASEDESMEDEIIRAGSQSPMAQVTRTLKSAGDSLNIDTTNRMKNTVACNAHTIESSEDCGKSLTSIADSLTQISPIKVEKTEEEEEEEEPPSVADSAEQQLVGNSADVDRKSSSTSAELEMPDSKMDSVKSEKSGPDRCEDEETSREGQDKKDEVNKVEISLPKRETEISSCAAKGASASASASASTASVKTEALIPDVEELQQESSFILRSPKDLLMKSHNEGLYSRDDDVTASGFAAVKTESNEDDPGDIFLDRGDHGDEEDKKDGDKSFTGFCLKEEEEEKEKEGGSFDVAVRRRCRKKKHPGGTEPKFPDEKPDESKLKNEIRRVDNVKGEKNEVLEIRAKESDGPKSEMKQEKSNDEGNDNCGDRLQKSSAKEFPDEDDVSRDSLEVKEILSREDKRKFASFSESIASPVISESTPSSPASLYFGDDPEGEKAHRSWKRSIMIVWSDISAHKNASIFLRPITEEKVPGYRSIVHRPTDLQTIKRQIETGTIRTTSEFQRDLLLMFLNAKMYNNSDHNIFQMAHEMRRDVSNIIEEFVATQISMARVLETPKSLRRETRESSAKRIGEDKRKKEVDDKTIKRRKLN